MLPLRYAPPPPWLQNFMPKFDLMSSKIKDSAAVRQRSTQISAAMQIFSKAEIFNQEILKYLTPSDFIDVLPMTGIIKVH